MVSRPTVFGMLLAVAALTAPFFAAAAEITLTPASDDGLDLIRITGDIEAGDEQKFLRLALYVDQALVILESDGGGLAPALEIGRTIQLKGFGTAVIDTDCASACAIIWMAGQPRSMSANAGLYFHAAWVDGKDGTTEQASVGNALIGAYLARMGLGESAIAFVTRAAPRELKRLTRAEADELDIPVFVVDNKHEAYDHHNKAIQSRWGGTPDIQASVRHYRLAADMGFAGSQNNLGDFYESGLGVRQSDKFAVYWYARAAERGEPTAYLSLATILAKDTKDPAVLVEALSYAILAADKLPPGKNRATAAECITTLRARMSDDDQKAAELMARKWSPLYQEPRLLEDTPAIQGQSDEATTGF